MKTIQEKLALAESIMKEFKNLRTLQKKYYSTPASEREDKSALLQQCKTQEKKVDGMVDDYFPTQQKFW